MTTPQQLGDNPPAGRQPRELADMAFLLVLIGATLWWPVNPLSRMIWTLIDDFTPIFDIVPSFVWRIAPYTCLVVALISAGSLIKGPIGTDTQCYRTQ